jgi:hypothetical protein
MNDGSSHTPTLAEGDEYFLLGLSNIMETTEGRYVLRRLLETYGVRQSTFTGDALSGARAQGFQEAGLLLEDMAEMANPALYLTMLKENQDDQYLENASARKRAEASGKRGRK